MTNGDRLLQKINSCNNMNDLDALRLEIVKAVQDGEDFEVLQEAFRKQKNRIRGNGW